MTPQILSHSDLEEQVEMQLEQLQLELQLELQVEHDDEDDEEREGRIRPMVSSGFLVTRAECPESKRGFCLAQSSTAAESSTDR